MRTLIKRHSGTLYLRFNDVTLRSIWILVLSPRANKIAALPAFYFILLPWYVVQYLGFVCLFVCCFGRTLGNIEISSPLFVCQERGLKLYPCTKPNQNKKHPYLSVEYVSLLLMSPPSPPALPQLNTWHYLEQNASKLSVPLSRVAMLSLHGCLPDRKSGRSFLFSWPGQWPHIDLTLTLFRCAN